LRFAFSGEAFSFTYTERIAAPAPDKVLTCIGSSPSGEQMIAMQPGDAECFVLGCVDGHDWAHLEPYDVLRFSHVSGFGSISAL